MSVRSLFVSKQCLKAWFNFFSMKMFDVQNCVHFIEQNLTFLGIESFIFSLRCHLAITVSEELLKTS